MAAGFFALATATRSMLATYVGVVGFLIFYFVLTGFSRSRNTTTSWACSSRSASARSRRRRNTGRHPTATRCCRRSRGIIGENRLIWFSISFVLLAIAYVTFRFEGRGSKRPAKVRAKEAPPAPHVGPLPAPRYDAASTRAQFWRWTSFEMGQVFKSPAFFVLLALGLLNALGSLWTADEASNFMIFPVTRIMIDGLIGAFTLIPVIVGIYYAGELVWRERDRRTHEVIDACPVPDWIFVVPKIAAISLVLFATYVVSVFVAVAIQAIKGYTNFEIVHYITWYVVPQAI